MKGGAQLHEASPPCPHRPPETQSPNAAKPQTKKSPFLPAAEAAWAAHILRQALLL